jgi:hypothetical protein
MGIGLIWHCFRETATASEAFKWKLWLLSKVNPIPRIASNLPLDRIFIRNRINRILNLLSLKLAITIQFLNFTYDCDFRPHVEFLLSYLI